MSLSCSAAKRGRIFFVALLVLVVVAAIAWIYAGYVINKAKRDDYFVGDLVEQTLNDYVTGETLLTYIDSAARYASFEALYRLPRLRFFGEGCSTPGGVLLIKPGCRPNASRLSAGFNELFDEQFRAYLAEDYVSRVWNQAPAFVTRYEYYSLGNTLYGLPYQWLSIDNGKTLYRVWPSFSVAMPFNITAPYSTVYDIALTVEEACSSSPDKEECLRQSFAELNDVLSQEWVLYEDAQTQYGLTPEQHYLKFFDEFKACFESGETNCYCTIDTTVFNSLPVSGGDDYFFELRLPDSMLSAINNNRLEPSEKVGQITAGIVIHETDKYDYQEDMGLDGLLCNFHSSIMGTKEYYRTRLRFGSYPGNTAKYKSALFPDPMALVSGFDKWQEEVRDFPVTFVKYNYRGTPHFCLLTTSLDKWNSHLINRVKTGVRAEHMGLPAAELNMLIEKALAEAGLEENNPRECIKKPPLYAVVKTNYYLPRVNESTGRVELTPLKFLIAFEQ